MDVFHADFARRDLPENVVDVSLLLLKAVHAVQLPTLRSLVELVDEGRPAVGALHLQEIEVARGCAIGSTLGEVGCRLRIKFALRGELLTVFEAH